MPKRPAAKLTAKERERFFIKFYVERGAATKHIAYCEKRARLQPGDGVKLLAKKSVQEEIDRLMQPVRAQQLHQATVTEATKKAKAAMQQELRAGINSAKRMKIELEVLDHELMSMAVGLDKNVFPKTKLEAIKAAYVVFGTLESGNTRRLIPPEHLAQNEGQGTYTSLFNRLALAPNKTDEPPQPEDGVYDLTPQPVAPALQPLPTQGEAIDEPATPATSSSRVITVEVG